MAWKGLFEYLKELWMIIMSLGMPMKLILKSDGYIGPPIMTLSLGGLWPTSGATTIFNVILVNGMVVPMVVEPPKVVELLGVVV
jgi:hypothetical protein